MLSEYWDQLSNTPPSRGSPICAQCHGHPPSPIMWLLTNRSSCMYQEPKNELLLNFKRESRAGAATKAFLTRRERNPTCHTSLEKSVSAHAYYIPILAIGVRLHNLSACSLSLRRLSSMVALGRSKWSIEPARFHYWGARRGLSGLLWNERPNRPREATL